MVPVEPALASAVLQAAPPEPNPATSLVGSAASAFLTTLVVGAVMFALAPEYTERMMNVVLEEPLGSFAYGLVVLAFLVLATILLAITFVGLVVAIPLALLAGVVWAVGATVGFLVVADRLVGMEEGFLKPLVVAAAINGALTLTGVGGLVAFCIGAAGFGAILRDWLE